MSSKRGSNRTAVYNQLLCFLEGVGAENSFLNRRILRVEDGLALIKVWEEKFGKLHSSTTPADPGI